MNAVDKLNDSNAGKNKDAYIETVDTVECLIRRISILTSQV